MVDSKFAPFSDTHPFDVVHDSDLERYYDNDDMDDRSDDIDDEEVDLKKIKRSV